MIKNIFSETDIAQLERLIADNNLFVLTCHAGPDGDALGSTLGMAHYLQALGKEALVVVPDAFPDFLAWMPGAQDIVRFDKHRDKSELMLSAADVIFAMDYNSLGRVDDMGDIAGGKARADIGCVKDSSHVYRLAKDRTYKVVYSYGWYLRKFVDDVREKGGNPVIVSMTPRNEWPGGKMERRPGSCASWAKEVAEELDVPFVDIHNLTADYLDRKAGSKEAAAKYYKRDHTHTSRLGAELNAKMFRKGIKKTDSGLKKLMK